MDRDEQFAGTLACADLDAIDAVALRRFDACETAVGQPEPRRIVRMHFDKRLLAMTRQLGCQAGACHAVPLVAVAAGVERQRPFGERCGQGPLRNRNEARAPVVGGKSSIGKDLVAARRRAGQREQAAAVIVVGRKPAMLAPDIGGPVVGEGVLPAHAPRDLLDDPPVGHRLSGQRKQRALTADRPVAVGDSTVLFPPSGGGQADMRKGAGVGLFDHVADDDEGAGGERFTNPVRVGHRNGGVGRHHP